MADTNNESLGIGVLVIIGAFLLFATDCFVGDGTYIEYPLYCAGQFANNECPGPWVQGDRTTYTVNADQQLVVMQRDGAAPTRLAKCAIVDKNNWKCNDASVVITVTKGTMAHTYEDSNNGFLTTLEGGGVKRVSKFEWLIATRPHP